MRGGVGSEYDVSLKTGGDVLKHLPREKYDVYDLLITKSGQWHLNGFPTTIAKIALHTDVVFNALHGEYGEDGKVQRMLEQFGILYTGSTVFASAVAMNKALAKYYFKQAGIKTPECAVVRGGDDIVLSARRVFRKFPGPYIVKPHAAGSSLGISVARDFESLIGAIKNALHYDYKMVLVEEYIKGREITCGVVDGARADELHALFPVEIVSPDGAEFFDYDMKCDGVALGKCPANLLPATTERVQGLAVAAHRALGLRHYSRSDFILSQRGLYILETNSLPGLAEVSPFAKSLHSAGLPFPEFLDYILTLAIAPVRSR